MLLLFSCLSSACERVHPSSLSRQLRALVTFVLGSSLPHFFVSIFCSLKRNLYVTSVLQGYCPRSERRSLPVMAVTPPQIWSTPLFSADHSIFFRDLVSVRSPLLCFFVSFAQRVVFSRARQIEVRAFRALRVDLRVRCRCDGDEHLEEHSIGTRFHPYESRYLLELTNCSWCFGTCWRKDISSNWTLDLGLIQRARVRASMC